MVHPVEVEVVQVVDIFTVEHFSHLLNIFLVKIWQVQVRKICQYLLLHMVEICWYIIPHIIYILIKCLIRRFFCSQEFGRCVYQDQRQLCTLYHKTTLRHCEEHEVFFFLSFSNPSGIFSSLLQAGDPSDHDEAQAPCCDHAFVH